MDITSLIVEAVSGAVGGNVAGAAMKEKSLGAVGNSIAGVVGGGIGGFLRFFIWRAPNVERSGEGISEGSPGYASLLWRDSLRDRFEFWPVFEADGNEMLVR